MASSSAGSLAGGIRTQAGDAFRDQRRELAVLAVLRVIDDFAVLDRSAVVAADVLKEEHQTLGFGGRRGRGRRRQGLAHRRHHQPQRGRNRRRGAALESAHRRPTIIGVEELSTAERGLSTTLRRRENPLHPRCFWRYLVRSPRSLHSLSTRRYRGAP